MAENVYEPVSTESGQVEVHTTGGTATKEWGEKVSHKVDDLTTQIKSSTNKAIDTTTRGIDRVTMYFRNKDTEAMLGDAQQMIRRHPGKSLLVGVLFGLMVGKVLR